MTPGEALSPEAGRYEVKFVSSPTDEERLRYWLFSDAAGFSAAYPPRRVSNAYFDSFGLEAYLENVEGACARSKHRLRWYGDSADPGSGQIEVKIRRARLGWKLVHPVALPDFAHTEWREIWSSVRAQLPLDLRIRFEASPRATLITSYRRHYFASLDRKVRVTFDTQYRAFDQRARSRPNLSLRANAPFPLVIEVKFASADREAGQRVVENLPLRVSRHSKYAIGINSLLY